MTLGWRDGDSLEQECPDCGRVEAPGGFCSSCFRKMGPTAWRRSILSDAQRAHLFQLAARRPASKKSPKVGTLT